MTVAEPSHVPWRLTPSQRSHARTFALQALCLHEAMGDEFDGQIDRFLQDAENAADLEMPILSAEQRSWAAELIRGAWQGRAAYDAMLQEAALEWAVARMPPVDRNTLRLGLHEWLRGDAPPFAALINDLIELGRRFGGADSPKFINGVLDGIRRKRDQAANATGG